MNTDSILQELSFIIGTEYNPLFHEFYIEQTAYNLNIPEQSVIDALHIIHQFNRVQNVMNRTAHLMYSNQVRPTKQIDRRSFVYVASLESDSTLFKIGISCNPVNRIKSMNRVCPTVQINLLHSFEADRADKIEKQLHSKYASKRVGITEWFRLNETDIDYLLSINGYFNETLEYEQ